MTRGRPPDQALREAKAIARRQGKLCENSRGRGLLYDFAIHLAFLTIYVQVRRMKTVASTAEDILSACARDIARIRRVPATAVLIRELWVRSPTGTWRYFLVLDDLLVEIPPEAMPENMAGSRLLKEEAPGPDRSSLPGGAPVVGEGYYCPFMVPSK
ncbi:MAG: hypothetical protein ABSB80_00365 [Methanoregula sp.]|jgi:hypothetical protein|uniref:hypothetical protein n=1 Tax=Methanoregula sp. TaxID=2052170 RepID=UPI003D0CE406